MTIIDYRKSSLSLTIDEAQLTPLGAFIAPYQQDHPDKSGIQLLGNPQDSFAARVLLIKHAQQTIDLQYYIWEKDVTGTLMFEALSEAAHRGVRVRLLLDDNGTYGLDEILLSLNRLDNFQVRLFNPFTQRRLKWLGYLTSFSRVNRRMHNKSFTVDNTMTVIGGRNIGDDYFGATSGILKQDLDLLAVGNVVDLVSNDFDKYWTSKSAYPIENIAQSGRVTTYTTAEYLPEQASSSKRDIFTKALKQSSFLNDLQAKKLTFEWVTTKVVSDDPAKVIGKVRDKNLLLYKLLEIIGDPTSSLLIVSPYFVPTKKGVSAFIALAKKGVSINILTNSMQATDVLPVHAGYAKHRKALLKAGIKLFELRSSTSETRRHIKKLGPFGSSASSLHAKTIAIDSEKLFVGSFNFDQRSIHLNTELGFVIDSVTLAQQVEQEFLQEVNSTAYQVKLDQSGKLKWLEQNGDDIVIYSKEPGMTLFSRLALLLLNALPIDWLL